MREQSATGSRRFLCFNLELVGALAGWWFLRRVGTRILEHEIILMLSNQNRESNTTYAEIRLTLQLNIAVLDYASITCWIMFRNFLKLFECIEVRFDFLPHSTRWTRSIANSIPGRYFSHRNANRSQSTKRRQQSTAPLSWATLRVARLLCLGNRWTGLERCANGLHEFLKALARSYHMFEHLTPRARCVCPRSPRRHWYLYFPFFPVPC